MTSDKKPQTAAQRKQAERQRKRDAGLKPYEIWLLADDVQSVRDIEAASVKKAISKT